jgi:type IV fimbrial biogenesis protein FimT
MPAMKSRQTAFTLIELMVTLLVLAILFGAAVPSFREFTRNNRVIAAQNNLVTAMSLARSEAIRRSSDVVVCASNAANTACSAGADWVNGWLVRDVVQDKTLQVFQAPGGEVTATGTVPKLTYQPIGTVATGGSITLKRYGCSGSKAHRVTVLVVGTPQAETVGC